jgi:hypothetical protein
MSEERFDWHAFDLTLAEVRAKFVDMPKEQLEALIDEAVAAVRDDKARSAG